MKHTNMTNNPHEITLQEAITMTHAYQNSPQFACQTKAVLITTTAIQELLNQPDCVGVRIYFALDLNNNLTTVLVGTDNADNDITSGTLLNRGIKCPPQCSLNSPLL